MHGSYLELVKNNKGNRDKVIANLKLVCEKATGYIYLADSENQILRDEFNIMNREYVKVYNGVPLQVQVGVKNSEVVSAGLNTPILLCASRAIKEKGWEELIEAARIVREKEIHFELWFAGDGPMLPIWKEEYSDLNNIKFLGYRSDIEDLINKADLILLPSYTEALPTILLESLMLGKPIISTEVGEMRQIGISINAYQYNAIIPIEPKSDFVPRLANSLIGLIDRENYVAYVKDIQNARLDFSLDKQVSNYIRIFTS